MGEKRKRQKASLMSLTMPHAKQEHDFGDELDEAGFGMETQHFFERSSEDHQHSDVEASVFENGRIQMLPDLLLEEPEYAGAKSSRKVAFEEDSMSNSELGGKDAFLNENQVQIFDFDQNSDEEQEDVQGLQSENVGEEMEALNKEYMELQAQEEEMLFGLRGRSNEEVHKSRAVSHQKGLWDKALETRILLQKSFSSANRLPLKSLKSNICETNTEVQKAFSRLTASSIETLGCLTEILKALIEQNNSVNEVCQVSANGNSNVGQDKEGSALLQSSDVIDQVWQLSDSLYSRFVPFRNSSLDRWQRKTQISSGVAASKSKLRALNQSISQQVETQMRDPSRMRQRMWLKRLSVEIFGMPVGSMDAHNIPSTNGAATEIDANYKDADYDPELIDDTEFYQELLREFLESSDPASIGNMYGVRKLQNKKRKVVDRRASKGRKIRYNVHDKLVNFMAPVPMNLPPMAEKMFSNLFGQNCQGNL